MAAREPSAEARQEAEVQEDLMRLEAYRNQLNALLQQHQILTSSRGDHLRARESLEGIDRAEPGAELLLPLGGEAIVRGSISKDTPVLIGVGSGVIVEMDRPRAVELLAERLVRIDQAIGDIEGQVGSLEERIQMLSRRLDSMAARASRGPSDVGGD
jgi:prefoldin alpha subunit